jgi:peptidase S46-like protein
MRLRVWMAVCALALPAAADEGLWPFNQFPKDAVKEKYNFEVTGELLDRLRLAAVSLGSGSGAFVSAHGLLATNQHLIASCLTRLGNLDDGFYAAARSEERPCPGLDAAVLVKLEDVTARVKGAAQDGVKPTEALEKRAAAMAEIEKTCAQSTGNSCTVVKLFSGERYDLYQYKKYSDLRLVFAPERAIAFFGGNPDSLAYPRYLFDVAFLRAYENGQPAETPQFLKWSGEGVKDGELVFAAGSPQSTSRLATPAQLTFYRDVSLPFTLMRFEQRIQDLRDWAAKAGERAHAAELPLVELASTYKWTAGKLIGVRDDWLMARKTNFEKKLKNAVQNDPKLGANAIKVWDDIATAYRTWTPWEKAYQVMVNPGAVGSNLFRMARQIVRAGERKPDESLYAATAMDDGIETAMLVRYLEDLKALGEKEVPLKAILGGKTPQQAAEEMVRGTKIKDARERRRLAADRSAAQKSDDPMLRLARQIEEPARKLEKKHAEAIESLDASATERIAHYRYQIFGAKDYPDATGTPRAAFGVVKAYRDRTEAPTPYATTFSGMYYLAASQYENYRLPQRWVTGRPLLEPLTPMDFVSTCDVTAGAAGSPAINQKGELVGITFEGNLESIANTYLYLDDRARAMHAGTQAATQALEKLYGAKRLLEELGVKP